MSRGDIIVSGAGIGGLAAALALARVGYRVTVLERALKIEEAGAGVQLAPNATRCLAFLGVLDRVRETAVRPRLFRVTDGKGGGRLAEARMDREAETRFGSPFLVIHRADLQAALLAAAEAEPMVAIRLGRTVEEFATHDGAVTVLANNAGTTEDYVGRALIGADGIRSTVRNRLQPSAVPIFSGRAAWRATVPADSLPAHLAEPIVRLWLGPGAHLVSYPISAGTAVNLVAVTPDDRPAQGWGVGADRDELTRRFAGWSRDARALVGRPERWLRWALFDIDPMKSWGTGPVTLLGDAAHAMFPFLAQGAAQALEDACVLGLALQDAGDDMPAALRIYEQLRIARTARVQKAARANGRVYHLKGPARVARDFAIRARSGAALLERYAWIYEWGP